MESGLLAGCKHFCALCVRREFLSSANWLGVFQIQSIHSFTDKKSISIFDMLCV